MTTNIRSFQDHVLQVLATTCRAEGFDVSQQAFYGNTGCIVLFNAIHKSETPKPHEFMEYSGRFLYDFQDGGARITWYAAGKATAALGDSRSPVPLWFSFDTTEQRWQEGWSTIYNILADLKEQRYAQRRR